MSARRSPVFGPEPWDERARTTWSHWDLWFCLMCVVETDGDWGALEEEIIRRDRLRSVASRAWERHPPAARNRTVPTRPQSRRRARRTHPLRPRGRAPRPSPRLRGGRSRPARCLARGSHPILRPVRARGRAPSRRLVDPGRRHGPRSGKGREAGLAVEVYTAAVAGGGWHVDHLIRRCRELTGVEPSPSPGRPRPSLSGFLQRLWAARRRTVSGIEACRWERTRPRWLEQTDEHLTFGVADDGVDPTPPPPAWAGQRDGPPRRIRKPVVFASIPGRGTAVIRTLPIVSHERVR